MKTIDGSIVAAVNADGAYSIDFVSLIVDPDDTDNQLHVSNGFRDYTFNGRTYVAGNNLLSIGSVDDVADVRTNGIEVSLSGLDDTILAHIAGQAVVGSSVEIYRGYWDVNTGDIIAEPYLRWKGGLAGYAVHEANSRYGTVTVMARCENVTSALLRASSGRFTSPSSFDLHNDGDISMEYVETLVNWKPQFGAD